MAAMSKCIGHSAFLTKQSAFAGHSRSGSAQLCEKVRTIEKKLCVMVIIIL
jgi:hypothetical protein